MFIKLISVLGLGAGFTLAAGAQTFSHSHSGHGYHSHATTRYVSQGACCTVRPSCDSGHHKTMHSTIKTQHHHVPAHHVGHHGHPHAGKVTYVEGSVHHGHPHKKIHHKHTQKQVRKVYAHHPHRHYTHVSPTTYHTNTYSYHTHNPGPHYVTHHTHRTYRLAGAPDQVKHHPSAHHHGQQTVKTHAHKHAHTPAASTPKK